MSPSEDIRKKSLVWQRIGPIADPPPPFEFYEKYLEYLDEEQQKQMMARELDLRIKVMEHNLETLKMTSQMLKKKG